MIELKNDDKKIKTILDFYILTNRLKDLLRAGWQHWGIKRERAESVAEHIYGTCMLALAIWSETLPEINISEVIMMLALHETEEIIINDITPFDDEKKLNIKKEGEKAVETIFKNLIAKEVYFKLVQDFNERKTPEAIFAYKCDKLECDLQARLYSDQGCLSLENSDNIKNNQTLKEYHSQGLTDVADFFAKYDKKHFADTDDIFAKINNYIFGRRLKK